MQGFSLRPCTSVAPVAVPLAVQRLLAFVALHRRPQHRSIVAGTLWIDSTEERAAASLRSTLWRLRQLDDSLVTTRGNYLVLGDAVRVDVDDIVEQAHRLANMEGLDAELESAAVLGFVDELLPEWSDDWILIERERLRQIGLHGLETLSARLSLAGRHGTAVEAALLAVACEPLRETAQRALIVAHLAEGNVIEASRAFDAYTKLLDEALGITPGPDVIAMMAHFRR